jgi:hypothetical protein
VFVFGALAVGICAAQQGAMTMKEVLRADLSAPGHEVVQSYIVIPTGAASGGKHTHPGEEIAFVIEGSLRVEIDGEPPVVKNAGESIIVRLVGAFRVECRFGHRACRGNLGCRKGQTENGIRAAVKTG